MSKTRIITVFRNGLNNQEFIVTRIRNSIKFNRSKEILEIIGQEEEFGSIMKHPANKFKELLGTITYNAIMESYYQWRDECVKIYKVYLQDLDAKKPKFNKLTISELDILNSRLDNLEMIHKVIMSHSNTALTRLNALSEDKFN